MFLRRKNPSFPVFSTTDVRAFAWRELTPGVWHTTSNTVPTFIGKFEAAMKSQRMINPRNAFFEAFRPILARCGSVTQEFSEVEQSPIYRDYKHRNGEGFHRDTTMIMAGDAAGLLIASTIASTRFTTRANLHLDPNKYNASTMQHELIARDEGAIVEPPIGQLAFVDQANFPDLYHDSPTGTAATNKKVRFFGRISIASVEDLDVIRQNLGLHLIG